MFSEHMLHYRFRHQLGVPYILYLSGLAHLIWIDSLLSAETWRGKYVAVDFAGIESALNLMNLGVFCCVFTANPRVACYNDSLLIWQLDGFDSPTTIYLIPCGN